MEKITKPGASIVIFTVVVIGWVRWMEKTRNTHNVLVGNTVKVRNWESDGRIRQGNITSGFEAIRWIGVLHLLTLTNVCND
jgi:hypothetical protein